jgi:succinylglutamate desuccinylase
MSLLRTLDALPAGFLDIDAMHLERLLPGPTLIHLAGRRAQPLFVSVLLHGNEDSGLGAVQQVLRRHGTRDLPRALSLFVGNVSAAARNERFLAGQPDYNRIWPGSGTAGTAEHAMAFEVTRQMHALGPFASIDVHNNTGINPHYGCVSRLDAHHLQLAALYSRLVVYTQRPQGTQCAAFSAMCPAVTIECGKTGNAAGAAAAAACIDAALHVEHLPDRPVDRELSLYHTVAVVKVREGVRFAFDATVDSEVSFEPQLDHMNFQELPVGTRLARCSTGTAAPLLVQGEDGRDLTAHYFELQGGELRTRRAVVPAMLTRSITAVRQDCLCYLMEPMAH